jgi:hypothetical protein
MKQVKKRELGAISTVDGMRLLDVFSGVPKKEMLLLLW